MKYSIYARTLAEAQAFAKERGWGPREWILFILDIDEPYSRLRGVSAA